jgi:chorismate mutase
VTDQPNPTQPACRGIRGAITVEDGPGAVDIAVAELLDAMLSANNCATPDIAAALFTLTDDLAGANPAAAARARGWEQVPLLMSREHMQGDIKRCMRVLLLVNTPLAQSEVTHIYLRGAARLRPDLVATS